MAQAISFSRRVARPRFAKAIPTTKFQSPIFVQWDQRWGRLFAFDQVLQAKEEMKEVERRQTQGNTAASCDAARALSDAHA
jgi:hypothetical protein